VDAARCWELLGSARVARFATLAPGGRPSLVPVCFAIAGETIYHAVDHKPKATRALARLEHLRADPRAALLADHYDDEDWSRLWWVRADGTGRVLDDAPEAIDLLVEKYPQYRERRPEGPVVALEVERISGWSADAVR
jgi:PPOX class probable F420-dependent enzyme